MTFYFIIAIIAFVGIARALFANSPRRRRHGRGGAGFHVGSSSSHHDWTDDNDDWGGSDWGDSGDDGGDSD